MKKKRKTKVKIQCLKFGPLGRMFANGPGDQGSIPGRVIPKTQKKKKKKKKKWYLISPCLTLNIIRHVSRVKWSNPGKGVTSFATPQCNSY